MGIKVGGRQNYDMDGLLKEIEQPQIKVVIYFFSVEYERFEPQKALKRAFPRAICIGASMYGGWCTVGVMKKGIVAMSLGADEVEEVFVTLKEGVKADPTKSARAAIDELKQKLGYRNINPDDYLGIVLFDGLSQGEIIMQELSLEARLNLPFVGGAAADEMSMIKTLVGLDEQLSPDGLVLLVMKMKIPFYYNHYVHLTPGTASMVVTKADAKQRIVWEINGEPAASYYANLVGVEQLDRLDFQVFAANSLGVISGNRVYCRSLNSLVEGRGLRFYCYIEAGTTLYLLKPGDIIADARNALQDASAYLSQLQGVILFSCAFRLLELKALNKIEAFNNVFKHLPFIGSTSYGEELFTHHNQTLTAIFFGRP
ncbi:MAG: FIST C-terminal domain-containing protein [Treponema sp.]|jgi:hypothetical protein|nr:FIST C-terminal domain-containing protein [Treponema sp.]